MLGWYAEVGRPLAFRRTTDPWQILVSEVMAQQTQAARAAEAWERFIVAYPTPDALAAASPAEVLRAWRGLGYNRRALALQRAARAIVEEHGGRVPSDLPTLERLPGVGPYTARAVASLAYGRRVGAVDTNVRRVLGRAFLGVTPTPHDDRVRTIQSLADQLAPRDRPGTWTHALMDLGATICRSRGPRCDLCPIRATCRYVAAQPTASAGRTTTAAAQQAPRTSRRSPSRARGGFPTTSRWLRGRILDRLRDVDGSGWLSFPAAIGEHDAAAVAVALRALAAEGLLELHDGPVPEARLPAP